MDRKEGGGQRWRAKGGRMDRSKEKERKRKENQLRTQKESM